MSEAPSPQQITAAIRRIHEAFREAWPKDEFMTAEVSPTQKPAWAAQWSKAREGWRDECDLVVEALPLAASVAELDGLARDLIGAIEISAQDFRVEILRLDEP